MNSMRALTLLAVAAGAAAGAVGQFGEPVFEPAMAQRDNSCSELPKLCTDYVMLHGDATTLTYLCPETTQDPTTVLVTVTATTTVTVAPVVPTNTAPAISPANASPAGKPTPTTTEDPTSITTDEPTATATEEPTTTITIQSTLTQYKTITVLGKSGSSSVLSLTPAVITNSFSEGVPPVHSLVPPVTKTDIPVSTHSKFLVSTPSMFAVSTPSVFLVSTPSVFLVSTPSVFPVSTPFVPPVNGTTSGVYRTRSVVASIANYPNTTSYSGHGNPTHYLAREANPISSTTTTVTTSMAGQTGLPFAALFLSLLAAAYLI